MALSTKRSATSLSCSSSGYRLVSRGVIAFSHDHVLPLGYAEGDSLFIQLSYFCLDIHFRIRKIIINNKKIKKINNNKIIIIMIMIMIMMAMTIDDDDKNDDDDNINQYQCH